LLPETRTIDVLVVGAGPAGLAAAEGAARCGARVIVLDERAQPGGQYFKQPAKSQRVVDARLLDRQVKDGRDRIAKVRSLGVEITTDAVVWGVFGIDDFAASVAGRQVVFVPRRVIVATGAYERGVPVPGWTLPGYMTTGAAQSLLRAYRVLPGREDRLSRSRVIEQ
jgi:NADPH-dependent 2,4-dienoyl-CoA reductase/sulfur reductase-like enzyme